MPRRRSTTASFSPPNEILVDAQLPPLLCRWLQARGHEALHVATIMPGDTPDRDIAAYAASQELILVTKDEDFSTLVGICECRLLWLRCGNTTNTRLGKWLESRWPFIERLMEAGEQLVEVR